MYHLYMYVRVEHCVVLIRIISLLGCYANYDNIIIKLFMISLSMLVILLLRLWTHHGNGGVRLQGMSVLNLDVCVLVHT